MKSVQKVACAVALLAGIAPALRAQDEAKVTKKPEPTAKYAVVQVGKEISVVEASTVAAMREKIAAENKASMEAWTKAKDAAAAAKKPFSEKQPAAKSLKVIGDQLTKEEADRARVAELAKEAKARATKSASAKKTATKRKTTEDEGASKHKKK